MTDTTPPEVILCDTSLVSVLEMAEKRPELVTHWPQDARERLDAAFLAISIFSIAELRAGRIAANWGQSRAERQEKRLTASFVTIPLDDDALNAYTVLHAWSNRGNKTPHNDMWIAATAISRGLPLASCDEHFERIAASHDLQHIYLPRQRD